VNPKPTTVRFFFQERKLGKVEVCFTHDASGDPVCVRLLVDGAEITSVDNFTGGWKPCMTHAVDLIRLHLLKTPAAERNQADREELAERSKEAGLTIHTPDEWA
jgi:hypothetical protein